LLQRLLFPTPRPGPPGQPSRATPTVTITRPGRAPETGVLIQEDDFYVTWQDDEAVIRVARKGPEVGVVVVDPLKAHHELLDRITDANMHDLVAYLVTLR
jgi:cytochrome c oxidase cbb3-type subunit 3